MRYKVVILVEMDDPAALYSKMLDGKSCDSCNIFTGLPGCRGDDAVPRRERGRTMESPQSAGMEWLQRRQQCVDGSMRSTKYATDCNKRLVVEREADLVTVPTADGLSAGCHNNDMCALKIYWKSFSTRRSSHWAGEVAPDNRVISMDDSISDIS